MVITHKLCEIPEKFLTFDDRQGTRTRRKVDEPADPAEYVTELELRIGDRDAEKFENKDSKYREALSKVCGEAPEVVIHVKEARVRTVEYITHDAADRAPVLCHHSALTEWPKGRTFQW